MFDKTLFGDLEQRGSKDSDKKIISRLSERVRAPSSNKNATIKDKMERIRQEVNIHLSFLLDRVESCREDGKLENYVTRLIENGVGSIDTETTGLDYFRDAVFGWSSWTTNEKSIYVPMKHYGYITGEVLDNQISSDFVSTQLRRVRDSNVKLIYHSAKFDMHMIYHNYNVMLPVWWDTMIASRLLHSAEQDHSLKYQYNVKVRGGKEKPYDFKTLFDGVVANSVPIDVMTPYAAGDTFETIELQQYQEKEFKKYPGIYNVFKNIEMPLLPIVVEMEETGVLLDREFLNEMEIKYTQRLEDAKSVCYNELAKYEDKLNTFRLRNPGKLDNPVNLSSPSQIAIVLYDIMGLEELQKYKRGTGKPVLQFYKKNNKFVEKLLEVRDAEKLLNGFIKTIPDYIQADGRVHSEFVQVKGISNTNSEDEDTGADTGRFACIAEGQNVQVVNGQKKIEDIQIGDLVYCYDDSGNIHISKVTNKFDNGYRECVKITWQSTGQHCSGSLVCTPDHKIRRKDGVWVRADELKRYDKMTHLRRGMDNVHKRPRIYGSNSFMDLEQNIIKRDYFGYDNSFAIHHIDFDTMNNDILNLKVLTKSEHSQYHTLCRVRDGDIKYSHLAKYRNMDSVKRKIRKTKMDKISKDQTIQMLLDSGGSPTKCAYDYTTIMARVKEYNIDLEKIQELCMGLDVDNFTKVFFEECGVISRIASRLHIGTRKVHRYIDKYDLCYNHMVQSIKSVGVKKVWDLEVENYHNYIVSEICVHNCRNPNLQQIPSHGEKTELRKMFRASDGYIMMSSDYSQQEVRVLAHCSGNKEMLDAYRQDKDLYALMASKVYNKPYEECLEFYPEGTKIVVDGKEIVCGKKEHTNKEGKARRSACKSIVLGVMYGRGSASIAEQTGTSLEEAKKLVDTFYSTFPSIKEWMTKVENECAKNGYVETLMGRRRELPDALLPEYEFKRIGGRKKDFNPLDFLKNSIEEFDFTVDEKTQQEYINKLNKAFGWSARDEIIKQAREDGIEIKDNNQYKAKAKRQSVNSVIQGTSADMGKLAMIYCAKNEELKRLGYRLLFPIHDEIIAEAPIENAKRCGELMSEMMIKAANEICPSVPFKCDIEYMLRWAGDSYGFDEHNNLIVKDSH